MAGSPDYLCLNNIISRHLRIPMQSNVKTVKTSDSPLHLFFSRAVFWLFRTQEGILFLILAALWVFLTIQSPVFFTSRNIGVLLSQVSMTAITAIGMTILVIAGEIDASVGSMQAFVGVIVMSVLNNTVNLPLGILVGLLIGLGIGLINAFISLQLNINSLIATLAMLSIVRGAAFGFTDASIQNSHKIAAFPVIGNGFFLGIPLPVIFVFTIFIIFYFILTRTTFGRYVHAVGANPEAAVLAGIPVRLVKLACFIMVSLLASLSAIILLSRLNSGQNGIGAGFELEVIGAVLLGGTSLEGGEGTLLGTFLAVLLLGTLKNGIVLLDINSSWQVTVTGLIIIIAVLLDARRRRLSQD